MKKEKVIYMAFLISSVVLVSFRGGAIAWLLFYFILALPVLALSYILYIYFRLHIRQQVEGCVRKGERVLERLKLANEDLLLMSGIVLDFYTNTCQVIEKNRDGTESVCEQKTESFVILPHRHREMELILTCRYRGTYPVGVRGVSVTDFFGLFTITYSLPEQNRVTVLPRILPFERIRPQLEKRNPKTNRSAAYLSEMLGFELRKYIPGDSLHHIHWKNSARAGELLVRKQLPQELSELVIIMDCTFLGSRAESVRMQIEDNIIETAVALVFDVVMKKVGSRVVWSSDELQEMRINHRQGFDKFYQLCSKLPFCASMTLEEIWETYERKINRNPVFVLISCEVSAELSQMVDKRRRLGKNIVLIDTGEEPL